MNRNITEFFKIPESIRVPILGGILYRLFTKLDNDSIRKEELPKEPLNSEVRQEKVIVSLASYPARIHCVHLAIKSLMLQTYKPDKIILWLAKAQFPDKVLPQELIKLQDYGLEIRFCETDVIGHKKYFFAVQEQEANELVVTFDDDIIYPKKTLERLIKVHRKFPNCVVCERGQVLNRQQLMMPGRWKTISSVGVKTPTYSMNPSPGSGCLFPYGAMHKDATNEEKLRELALRADDVWNMFMCVSNSTRMIKTRKYHKIFSLISTSQNEQLATGNVGGSNYSIVMEKLIREYPKAWERILTDKD